MQVQIPQCGDIGRVVNKLVRKLEMTHRYRLAGLWRSVRDRYSVWRLKAGRHGIRVNNKVEKKVQRGWEFHSFYGVRKSRSSFTLPSINLGLRPISANSSVWTASNGFISAISSWFSTLSSRMFLSASTAYSRISAEKKGRERERG